MRQRQRMQYGQRGIVAFAPHAVHELFDILAPEERQTAVHEGVAVVDVRGPIESQPGPFWDSYDDILQRTACAFDAPGARAVVLRVCSPGGDAHGCFEAARALRALANSKPIPLVAFVEDKACSAAYALACGAQRIFCGASSLLGSIGVSYIRLDVSAANEARGIRYAFVTSGARKADGNPDAPLTAEELAAQQVLVDDMSALFFDLVRELRGVETQPLQAAVFLGAAAVERGLADEVVTFEALRARLTNGEAFMTAYEEARAALEKAAQGEGDDAAKAKRALAAMDGEPEAEGDGEEPEAEGDGEEPAAESAEEEEQQSEKKKDDEPPPAARAQARAAAPRVTARAAGQDAGAVALAEVRKLTAQIARERKKDRDDNERATLLASRPDWSPEQKKRYAKHSIDTLRALAGEMPKTQRGVTARDALAAQQVKPTAGKGQVTPGGADAAPVNSLSARMGLARPGTGIVATDYRLTLGAEVEAAPAEGGA